MGAASLFNSYVRFGSSGRLDIEMGEGGKIPLYPKLSSSSLLTCTGHCSQAGLEQVWITPRVLHILYLLILHTDVAQFRSTT